MDIVSLIIAFISGMFGTNLDPSPATKEYAVYRIAESAKISLIENFEEKKSTEELMKENRCLAGINGGFYGEDDKPLGWFMTGGVQIQRVKSSSLFNGFVWQSDSGELKISRQKPSDNVNWGFQSGPMVMENGRTIALNIRDDRLARRAVIGVDKDGRVVFVHTDPVNLAELPGKIAELNLITAINLDGGSASAFYGDGEEISESSAVGSWMCVKK